MRQAPAIAVLAPLLLIAGCSDRAAPPATIAPSPISPSSESLGPTTSPPLDGGSPTVSQAPSAGTGATPSLPPGTPASYDPDVPAGDVPPTKLVPEGTDVEGTWFAATSAGEAIVVSFSEPSGDPFRRARGIVVWRHFDDAPAWRPVLGAAYPQEDGVMSIQGLTADVTGDGSDDVLLQETTGGSGACARWVVIDPAAAATAFSRELCDARVDPSGDTVGLAIVRSVYEEGDAHCCPSGTRTYVLVHEGGRWTMASSGH